MRYNELLENDDNDMFGSSERVGRDIRRATFNANIPEMIQDIIQGLGSNAGITIRAISSDLAAANRVFRGDEEVYELADQMITREAVQVLPGIMNTLAAEPEVIQDEDRLGDILMDFIPEVRAESELWAYVEEMLMEVYDEDDISKIEEIQYDCAQSMEYNLGSLLTKLIQQAFAEVRALGEDTDDDLFSKRRDRPVNRFTIYINNKALHTMIDLEQAVGVAEDMIKLETRRVNVQVVNAFDGEILWSGGTTRKGSWHGDYVRYLEETDDDDLFSDRPNGKVIAQDLELWLRRRQSGSRRTLMPTSEKYVQEVIAAFNRSFLEGVQIWREYPLYGNTDIKYDIREYLENSQNVNLMDYVQ
jgi:hypothetical protein